MSVTKIDKNKYRIFISDGFNLDGSRRRFTKTITTDLKGRDLERFLTLAEYEFEDEVKKKDPKFIGLSKGTFENYSKYWIDYKSTHDNIAPKTRQEYQKLLDTRILNIIGNKTLDTITNGDMLEVIRIIKESPAKTESGVLSDKSIKHHHTLLKTMFNDAVKLNVLKESPMTNIPIKTPKVQLKDNYYDLEDIKKLLDLLPTQPIKHQLATLIALSTGMRLGELTGLEWKHIDLDNLKIRIEQANSYTKEEGSFIKDTKNTSSERTVAFPRSLIPLFEKHREIERMKGELYGTKEKFLFTQENGDTEGKCIGLNTFPKWFSKFIKKNNLKKITFHGLRHTNTTILINKGVNVVSISHSLGHAKTSTTTDFYAHHLESVEREMANTFEDILQSGTEGGTQEEKLRLVK